MRTLLTLFGITWGTVSVALLVSFGEGLEARVRKNQRGLGQNIVIAWPSRTSLPFEGLGKGRRIRVSEEDMEALRREIPEASFSGEYMRDSAFRRERTRIHPGMSATNPVFAVMRNLIPASGGRYVDDIDVNRRRRVVFLGDKLKQDLFGAEDAIGKTLMIDGVPFLVVGVMQTKAQDSSYSGRDQDKAFMPESTYRGLYSQRYVNNFVFQARSDAAQVPYVTRRVYEVLGRRHKFDPKDKEVIGMWDTTEGEKFFRVFFGTFRAFLGVIGSFTLIVGGIGVSNIMYVVVEERTREIGIKLAVGAKPRFIQGQFLLETLLLTTLGGVLGFLITLLVMAVFPAQLDQYVGTPQASPAVILTTAALLGVIGLVAGYFPARRASLLDPVVALKLA
jgi:putative ABC transport system permease protein